MIANLLLQVLWECLVMTINNYSIPLQETLISKVLKLICEKLWCLFACKKSISSLTFISISNFQACYFGNYGNFWQSPSKIVVSICRRLSCLPAYKKLTSLRISFLIRYCKEMVNLLFCVTWAYLENANINSKKILMFICRQKINFILHLQRYCKLVI